MCRNSISGFDHCKRFGVIEGELQNLHAERLCILHERDIPWLSGNLALCRRTAVPSETLRKKIDDLLPGRKRITVLRLPLSGRHAA